MADIVSSEGDEVTVSILNRLDSSLCIESIVTDDQSSEERPKSLANMGNLLLGQNVVHSSTVAVLVG